MQRSRMPSGVRGTKSGGGGVRVLKRMEVCVLCPWLYRQPAPSSIPVPRVSLAAPQRPGSGCLCQIHWAVGRISTTAYLVGLLIWTGMLVNYAIFPDLGWLIALLREIKRSWRVSIFIWASSCLERFLHHQLHSSKIFSWWGVPWPWKGSETVGGAHVWDQEH